MWTETVDDIIEIMGSVEYHDQLRQCYITDRH